MSRFRLSPSDLLESSEILTDQDDRASTPTNALWNTLIFPYTCAVLHTSVPFWQRQHNLNTLWHITKSHHAM